MNKLIMIIFLFSGTVRAQNKVDLNENKLSQSKEAAFSAQWNLLHTIKPAEEQEAILKKLKKDFKGQDFDVHYFSIAIKYARENKVKKSIEFVKNIRNMTHRISCFRLMESLFEEADRLKLRSLVKTDINKFKKTGGTKQDYYNLLWLYGMIEKKTGAVVAALSYVEEAYHHLPKNEMLSRDYYYLMSVNGRYQESFSFMENLVRVGLADEEIKTELEKAYLSLHPDKDISLFMSSLKQQLSGDMIAHLDTIILNKPSPDFMVKDVSGEEVFLSDYKGKIVVIDFWATWCGPCVAALPAMQRVVDNYSTDSDVKFLFIHTLNTNQDPLNDAIKFLAARNFRLDLFIDAMDSKTATSPAYAALGYKGIPTKIVIDRNGIIRFRLTGFKYGDDRAVEELTAMIEKSKIFPRN